MEIAELVVDEKDPGDHSAVYSNAAGSLAVLAQRLVEFAAGILQR